MFHPLAWAKAHPSESLQLLIAASALCNYVWKPRSQKEYSELPPRLAGFLKFMSSAFPDPRGILSGVAGVVLGKTLPQVVEFRAASLPPPAPDTPITLPDGMPVDIKEKDSL